MLDCVKVVNDAQVQHIQDNVDTMMESMKELTEKVSKLLPEKDE